MEKPCTHRDLIRIRHTDVQICGECVALGDTWVHLRLCTSCGHVGCCDSSRNKHASRHFETSGHPVIRSAEPGEGWYWCYVDETYLEDGGED